MPTNMTAAAENHLKDFFKISKKITGRMLSQQSIACFMDIEYLTDCMRTGLFLLQFPKKQQITLN